MRFDRSSFFIFLGVLLIEIIIGGFFRDGFIRHFLGDVLIVVLICYFVRAWFAFPLWKVILGTLIFAYLVEGIQSLKLIDILGWRGSQLAHLTIGSTFDWMDMLAYMTGSGISLAIAIVLQNFRVPTESTDHCHHP
jgi:hypothetical protein